MDDYPKSEQACKFCQYRWHCKYKESGVCEDENK